MINKYFTRVYVRGNACYSATKINKNSVKFITTNRINII